MNKNENENEIVSFKVITRKCLYNSPDFKIYSCEPSFDNISEIQQLKTNSYGGVTIKGNFQELDIDCGYAVRGVAVEDKKYGYGYSVQNIRRDIPQTIETSRQFLLSVITEQQTETLLAVYPDIVSRIVNDDLEDIDLNKTKGIKEYTFEVIKRKVIENFKLAELVEEYGGVFSLAIIRKLYDTYPSIEKIRDSLVENPYECLCKLGGIGFKSADELLLKLEKESKERIKQGKKPIIQFSCDLISSYQRMKSCIVFLIEQSENEGNTYIDGRELHKQCKEIVPEAIHNFADVLKNEEDIHFDRDSAKVAKIYTYNTEKYIADRIKEGLAVKNIWNVNYTKYYKVDDFELSDEQKQTCKSVCENTITILVGWAGTGKTHSTKALINLINDNNKNMLVLAPTGRASKVIAGYTDHPASTIHRGLGFKPPKTWSYNEETKLDCDIVILDEFSMVDIFLFRHLLEAIDFTKTKLLLIGDDAQIPSVACGNLLHDFLNSDRIPTVRLTKIFRYGKGGINTVATDIRTGKPSFDKNNTDTQIIGDDKGFIYIPIAQERAINYIVKLYKKLLEKGIDKNDILILISQNIGDYGTQRINKRIQFEVNPDSDKYVKYGETEYRVNDLIIQCVNNYKSYIYTQYGCNDEKTFISNGEIGKIVDVVYDMGEYGIVVDFGNKNLIFIPKSQLGSIKLGYSITMHKCIPADTMLLTDKGQMTINELNNNAPLNSFKSISSDIKIFNGTLTENPVNFYNAGISKCKKIVTSRGYEFTGTLDHKIKVLDKSGKILMKELDQVNETDYALINIDNNVYNEIDVAPQIPSDFYKNIDGHTIRYDLPTEMNENLATMLGMIVADGCVANDRRRITYGKNQKDVSEYFAYLVKEIFNYDVKIHHIDGICGGIYHADISSVYLNKYFSSIGGLRPNDKYVPDCILKSSRKIQCAFIKGLFEDGTVNCKNDKFDHIEFSSCSKKLIKQVKIMLLNLGIICTQRERHNICFLYIYKRDAKIFVNNIGFINKKKQENLEKCLQECVYSCNYTVPYILNSIKEYTTNKINWCKYTNREKDIIRRNKCCSIKALRSIILKSADIPCNIVENIEYLCQNVYLDKIENITECEEHCYCLEMSEHHYFFQDGFIGSNCQGGQARYIIVFAPKAHSYMLNSNLLYVGVTRAKEKCILIGELDTYNKSIKKKENLARNTFMCELLKGGQNE